MNLVWCGGEGEECVALGGSGCGRCCVDCGVLGAHHFGDRGGGGGHLGWANKF